MQLLYALIFCLFSFQSTSLHADILPKKTITITVNEKQNISIDGLAVNADDLAKELQQRFWRSYMTTGKMPGLIKLEINGQIPEISKKNIQEAIKEGQRKTTTALCIHKFKKRFEDIGIGKQKKIQKQYPALFQQFN